MSLDASIDASMPQPVRIRLLSKIEVWHTALVKFPYIKVQALLLFLLLEPGKHTRDKLAELLWPEPDLDAAKTNLRNVVHALRRLFGEARIGSDRNHVWFNSLAQDEVDLLQLETAVKLSRSSDEPVAMLLRLVEDYAGELMPGFSLPDAEGYMEWLDIRRLTCHRQMLVLTEQLFLRLEAEADRRRQVELAQAQTRIDPWNESFHLRLIQLLVQTGRQSMALAHYSFVRELFQRELDIVPGPALQALVEPLKPTAKPSLPSVQSVIPSSPVSESTRPIALLYVEIRCLPPHDALALKALRDARLQISEVVSQLGALALTTPDGSLLAYFGYPEGLPNACQRAMRAALHLRERSQLPQVLLRQILHQGPMLMSDDPRNPDALGLLSAVAIKLVESARSGDILVTEPFARRLNLLELTLIKPAPVFYLHPPIDAYRLDTHLVPPRRQTPLVGQDRQRTALRNLWRAVRRGKLRAAVIGGSPGCGKSRLLGGMVDGLGDPNQAIVIECRQTFQNVPYAPLIEAIKRQCGIHGTDSTSTRAFKLGRWLSRRHPHLSQPHRRMIEWMTGLPVVEDDLSPTTRRRLVRDAVLAMLAHQCGQTPVLVVVEDLHWADPSTLELIDACLAGAAHLPWMLLVSSRQPLADVWQPSLPRINPEPLNEAEARSLIHALSAEPPTTESVARIIAEAEGNPLFIEALTQVHASSKSVGPALSGQTHSLAESLLDALTNHELPRRIGQGAAALGEIFDVKLLRAVFADIDDDRFHSALRVLQRQGLVHRPEPGQARFHHALIRDALYDSTPTDERRRLHGRIFVQASARLPEAAERHPGWLGRHAALAGDLAGATELYESAAQHALGLAAYTEAVSQLQAARSLVDRLPASLANELRVMRLLLAEGNATVALCGYGAAQTRALFSQVLTRSGDGHAARHDEEERFLAHYGLWLGGSSHGGYREALRYVERLRLIAETTRNPVHQLQTAYAFGNTYLWLGELANARLHLEHAVALYERHSPANLLASYSEDTGVISLSLLSWVIWLQGDLDAAGQIRQRSLALAQRLEHPYSRCFALACAGRLGVIEGNIAYVREQVEILLALSSRHDFAIWLAVGAMLQAWVKCAEGDPAGIALAEQSLALISSALPALEVTHMSMYVDALFRMGELKACAERLDITLQRCTYWQDHYMEAELLRLRALCAPAVGEATEVADGFLNAARVLAKQQGALSFFQRIDAA